MADKKKKKTLRKPSAPKKVEKKGTKKEEYISLFTLAGGILLLVFLYFPEGFVGSFIKDLTTGLVGWPMYVIPVLCIVNGLHKTASKNYDLHKSKYIIIAVTLGLLSVFTHLVTMEEANPFMFQSIRDNVVLAADGVGGGLIGGFIADLLRTLIGQAGAVIVMVTALLAVTMFFVNWSPVKMLLRAIIKTYAKTNNIRLSAKEYAAKEREKIEAENAEGKNDGFANFSDEEIGVKGRRVAKVKKKKVSVSEINAENESSDFDSFLGIDKIINKAVPEKSAEDTSSNSADEEDYLAPYANKNGNKDEEKSEDFVSENAEKVYEESEEFLGDEFDEENKNYVDAPKRLTGMEDVSEEIEEVFERIPYTFPPVSLLSSATPTDDDSNSRTELRETAQKLITTLKSFNVETKLLNVSKGPAVTRYELSLGEGIKVSKVAGLANDLALRLAAPSVRIEPVPGKDAIGMEIPNKAVSVVRARDVIDSDEFRNFDSNLAFAMGKDISGKNIVYDLSRMPHVLIAGSTGSGKSVCINTLIASIIYKADPNDVKLLMVDPKVVELGIYNGIPHLLIPVVTEPRRASGALYWAVQEMLRRYSLFADNNVRDIKGYNEMIKSSGSENTLPHIVIIIDELADLMMVAPKEVEDSICRLAQMARAAGMHLVIATQRPSVDVITGLIKANVPSRIAFAVSSSIDSRTILDSGGAEKLLGRGDMLFKPVGANKPLRIQGAFIDDKEVERLVEFIKSDHEVRYDEDIIEKIDAGKPVNVSDEVSDPSDNDELLPKAIELAVNSGKISASHIQRRLKVGFSRASRMIDQMEERGIISPPDGSKPREVLISKEDYYEMSLK
ncbi:MAG: DNA translocase FtsK [Clostridia bacterium]|nr:DNA translocase FtsK [Clostridia bacterium]